MGLFGNSDFASEASLRSACKRVSNEVQTLHAESLNRSRTRKLVSVLDHMSDTICQIADSVCTRTLKRVNIPSGISFLLKVFVRSSQGGFPAAFAPTSTLQSDSRAGLR